MNVKVKRVPHTVLCSSEDPGLPPLPVRDPGLGAVRPSGGHGAGRAAPGPPQADPPAGGPLGGCDGAQEHAPAQVLLRLQM